MGIGGANPSRSTMKDSDIRKAIKILESSVGKNPDGFWAYCESCNDVHFSWKSKEGCFSNLTQ